MGRKAYTKTQKIQKYLERNAGAKASEVAKATGVDVSYVYVVKSNSKKLKVGDTAPKKATKGQQLKDLVYKVTQGRGRPRKQVSVSATQAQAIQGLSGVTKKGIIQGATGAQYTFMDTSPKPTDMVNSPNHYTVGGIETIDFIEAKNLGYHLGNAIKYISRADHKGARIQDLEKAKWYLDREIKRLSA